MVTFCNEGDVTSRLPCRSVLRSLPLHLQAQAGRSREGEKFRSVGEICCEKVQKNLQLNLTAMAEGGVITKPEET